MRTSRFAGVGVGLVAALTLAACAPSTPDPPSGGPEQPPEGTEVDPMAPVHIGSLRAPESLDIAADEESGAVEALIGNVYETLFVVTDSGAVQPLLAAAHERSEDGLTHTFALRPDVAFHSGDPLVADDVVDSIERARGTTPASPGGAGLQAVDSVIALDDETVEVHLVRPSISLPADLARVPIANDRPDDDRTTTADGTGPYTLVPWEPGSEITLERNDEYWGDAAENERVVFEHFADTTALGNALLAGDIDIATGMATPGAAAMFQADDSIVVSDGTSTNEVVLAFNNRVAPFDDVRVRRAVSAAIDDEAVREAAWGDRGEVIGSMVPPTDAWYEDLSGSDAYDPDQARELLAEAGYPDGLTFTLPLPTGSDHAADAELIRDQLAEAGITADVEEVAPDEWRRLVIEDGEYEATIVNRPGVRDLLTYGDPNAIWGYDNPEVAEWIEQSELVTTSAEQTELLKLVARTITEDAVSEWLYVTPTLVVAADTVSGYPINGLGAQFFAFHIRKST